MLYRLARRLVYGFFRFFFLVKVEGQHHIPKEGRVMICSNHISNLDPPLIGCLLPRRINFLAKEELFRIPLFSQLIRLLGAIPVKRGEGDRQALKRSIQILQEEKVFGIFPEGTRSKTGQLGKAHQGAALIAIKAQAPIVPVAIIGPYRLFRPIRVVIGKPLDISPYLREKTDREVLTQLTERIMEEIQQLLNQHGK